MNWLDSSDAAAWVAFVACALLAAVLKGREDRKKKKAHLSE